ncbi:hypothetical protein GIB67_007224 [Kingdonia uniflora]|uniref:Uncharacterized protein n=1 Tax=Kingdonia uniflora TaxID=39325 RepID=A0A7J7NX90_9MAGN|nr:hypothetical protein GIB67_007224 [Kingdonia uniflora]
MSNSLENETSYSLDIEELLHLGTQYGERLDMDLKSFSAARSRDTKYIQELEKELDNCSQQIGYLQGQLNLRNIEANCLGEHVHSLELKLGEVSKLRKKTEEELMKSNSERFSLIRELENKEVELQSSTSHIEKLEAAISSIALESECEIESMKLDLTALEQRSSEAIKIQEKTAQENARLDEIIEEFEVQYHDAQKTITRLEKENSELREKLETSERNARTFCQRVERHLGEWLENNGILGVHSSCRMELLSKQIGTNDEVLGPFLSKFAVVASSYESIEEEMKKMTHQIRENEALVKQLKEELREEKSKANEEAEDLTQEMAEMRYEITGMLEQERKRRACIEQASLQRIGELEAQVRKEQKSSRIALKHFRQAQEVAESKSLEVHRLKILLEGLPVNSETNEVCRCGECPAPRNISVYCSNEGCILEAEDDTEVDSTEDETNIISQHTITWRKPVGIGSSDK